MTQGMSLRLAENRPFGARLDVLRGEPTPTAGLPITPIVWRLALWWPSNVRVYAWPVAIEYPEGQQTRHVRITNVRMLSRATFAALGLAAFAVLLARRGAQAQNVGRRTVWREN